MQSKVNTNIVGFCANSSYAKLGRNTTVNMLVETTKVENKGVNKVLYDMGGFQAFQSISGDCRGLHCVENGYDNKPCLFAVFGSKLYSVQNDTATLRGYLGTSKGKICFAEVPIYGGGDSFLTFVDGQSQYAIDITTPGELRVISLPMRESDMTRIHPTHIAYLYGMLVCNDSRNDAFYCSCTHPFFTTDGQTNFDCWMVDEAPFTDNPTDDDDGIRPYYQVGYVSYAEWKGDKTIALCSTGNNLYTIGTNSIQKWQYNNVSLTKNYAGSVVWSCPNSSCTAVGCIDANSLAQYADTIFFVGKAENGNRQVFSLSSSGPSTISYPELDAELAKSGSFYGFTCVVKSHPLYVLNLDTKTYAYDARESGWIELQSNGGKFRYTAYTEYNGSALFGTNGAITKWNPEVYTDCGTPILRKRTGHIVSDSHVVISEIAPIVNTGDATMDLRLNVSCDGKAFQQFQISNAGSLGDYDWRPVFWDCGEGHEFSVELSTTSNTRFCIKDMELVYETVVF